MTHPQVKLVKPMDRYGRLARAYHGNIGTMARLAIGMCGAAITGDYIGRRGWDDPRAMDPVNLVRGVDTSDVLRAVERTERRGVSRRRMAALLDRMERTPQPAAIIDALDDLAPDLSVK